MTAQRTGTRPRPSFRFGIYPGGVAGTDAGQGRTTPRPSPPDHQAIPKRIQRALAEVQGDAGHPLAGR